MKCSGDGWTMVGQPRKPPLLMVRERTVSQKGDNAGTPPRLAAAVRCSPRQSGLEGAQEAWAMVKMRYTGLDPNRMARVGPQGPDGKEIPVNLVYDQVMIAAKYSQEDCNLSSLIDDIDKE